MSSAAGKPQRSRRGRVLIVGDVPHREALSDMLAQPPALVRNMFEALGEVTSSSAQDPIAAIVIDEALTTSPHRCAIEALRRLDPSLRVVAITRGAEPPSAIGGASAPDAWLTGTLRWDDLRRVMDDDGLLAGPSKAPAVAIAAPVSPALTPPAPPSASKVFDLDATPAPSIANPAPARVESVPGQSRDRVGGESPVAVTATSEPAPAASAAASKVPTVPTMASSSADPGQPADSPRRGPQLTPVTDVGDTDLLHALLHDPAGVLPLALRLIGHHGRWHNVRFVDAAGAAGVMPTDGVEVRCARESYGRLLADNAAPGRLRPWADWLAHWLHMQREHERVRELCMRDDLTGAHNRRYFEIFLVEALGRARRERRPVTVMVFDIDNFKPYNDRFGHEAGDAILREIVRLLRSIVRQGDSVCRIGGDEFVVVFADPEGPRTPGSQHPDSIETIARRIHHAVNSMRFPKLGVEAPGTLSISAGLATFPWDGHDPATLLRHADHRALESKRKGKNAITLGPAPPRD